MSAPDSDDAPLPPLALFLKRLVLVLTVVMIAGFLTLIGALVIMLNRDPLPPPLPDQIALPAGVSARAFTQGTDWFAIVTDDDRILIYDRSGATLIQTVRVGAD